MRTRLMRSKLSLLFLTIAVLLAIPAIVLADEIFPDGDSITTNGNQAGTSASPIDLGTVAPGAQLTPTVSFELQCKTKNHVDQGQRINLGYSQANSTIPGGSLTATTAVVGGTTGIPPSWPDDDQSCTPDPTPIQDAGNSAVTITAPSSPGSYTYEVVYLSSFAPAQSDDAQDLQGNGRYSVFYKVTVANLTQNTTTAVTSNSNPSTYGNSVTFTATVNSSAGSPTAGQGTVTFKDGATTLCSNQPLNGSSQATCSTSTLGVGNHSITAVYSGTSSGTPQFQSSTSSALSQTVDKKELTVTADPKTKTYGQADPSPFTFTYSGGFVGTDAAAGIDTPPTCDVTGAHTNAGSYDITCSGGLDNNYSFKYVKGTLTVDPKDATVTADDKQITYGDPEPSFGYNATGLIGTDTLSGVSCGVSGAHTNAGSYDITCSGNTNTNYNVTSYTKGTLTVDPKDATVTADDKQITYGDPAPTFGYNATGLIGTDTLSGVSCGVTGAHTNAGSYDITCSGNTNTNYNVTSYTKGTLTVDPKDATVTADDKQITYGDPAPTFGYNATGLIGTDTLSGVSCGVSGAHTNAGSYDITCSGNTNTNYNVTSYTKGTLTVDPKDATVTADDKQITYGDPAPTFGYNATGLIGTDTLSGVSCGVSGAHTNAGSYDITCSGNTNTNYNVTSYTKGTLLIDQASLTVNTANQERFYGDANPSLTGNIVGIKNGDNITATYSTTATATSNVGPYPITATLSDPDGRLGNYNVANNAGTLTVTARAITVTADAKTKVLGAPDPALTYKVTAGNWSTATASQASSPATRARRRHLRDQAEYADGRQQLQPDVHGGQPHDRLQVQWIPAADQRHRASDGRPPEQVQARTDDPGEVHHLQRCRHRSAADAEPDVHPIGQPRGV